MTTRFGIFSVAARTIAATGDCESRIVMTSVWTARVNGIISQRRAAFSASPSGSY